MAPRSVVAIARKIITTTHAPGSHTHHREADATNRKRRDSMSSMPNRKTTLGTYHDFSLRTAQLGHAPIGSGYLPYFVPASIPHLYFAFEIKFLTLTKGKQK